MERLTDAKYWDENWWKGLRPRRLRLYRDFDYETVRLLRTQAGRGFARVLEIGAGGSRVLPYLRKRFGYTVFGADFSLRGCALLRANLALARVSGCVVCEDMFCSSLAPESFDLVFSSGLIEHFSDTRVAVALHLERLRPGGRLVLIVPNLQGVQGRIWRRLAPALWAKHKVFGPSELAAVLRDCGLAEVRCGYLGSFFIHIGRGEEWTAITRLPAWVQRLAHRTAWLASGIVSFIFRVSPVRPHSRAFSTAFYASGVKLP
ncbi:MAG: class I SAM-dependent methyltransferase [Terriglobia bacterium]